MTRQVRVICSDPYLTDCSSDEDKEDQNTQKRIVYQIDMDPTRPQSKSPEIHRPDPTRSPPEPPKMGRTRRSDPTRSQRNPYLGVYKRPSGKWISEIRERATRTRFYLGTFDSPEAASRAYCAKKRELEEKANLKKQPKACSDLDPTRPKPESPKIHPPDPTRSHPKSPRMTRTPQPDPTRNPRNPYPGVYMRPSGRWISEIRERVTHTRFYLGTFDSPEAAFQAYCAKKQELQEKADLKKKQKACFDDDMDSDYELGTMKRAKLGKWAAPMQGPVRRTPVREGRKGKAACESDNCSEGLKGRLEKPKTRMTQKLENGVTKLPGMVGTFGSGEADCGEKSGSGGYLGQSASGSDFSNKIVKCGLRNFKAIVQQATGFHGTSGIKEKAAFKEVKAADFGCGSIPREIASLILDENGFLLGEFSKIDDLSICVGDG